MSPADPTASIRIDAVDPDTLRLWAVVAKIARALEDEQIRWCLVGGLMVALFAIEAGRVQRPTTDIDILGDARQRPSATESLTRRLEALGAASHEITGLEKERGFRFDVDGQVVDVLAPDGLGTAARTRPGLQTIQIPGGSQALQRSEAVEIVVAGESAVLTRPTLLGAILLKARSLQVHSRPADQRVDLITLLGLMDDPRTARATLKPSEVKWLRTIGAPLNLDDADLTALFGDEHLRVARAVYRRLCDT